MELWVMWVMALAGMAGLIGLPFYGIYRLYQVHYQEQVYVKFPGMGAKKAFANKEKGEWYIDLGSFFESRYIALYEDGTTSFSDVRWRPVYQDKCTLPFKPSKHKEETQDF